MPSRSAIRAGSIVRGPTLPEPVEVLATVPLGESLKVIGRGLNTGLTYDPVLSPSQTTPGLDGIIAQAGQHLDELNNRLESRKRELELERHCIISDITHLGRAWVLPHPERTSPQLAPMVADPEIERLAVQEAIRYEEARGCVVESVESENRGFDLISRRPHHED